MRPVPSSSAMNSCVSMGKLPGLSFLGNAGVGESPDHRRSREQTWMDEDPCETLSYESPQHPQTQPLTE